MPFRCLLALNCLAGWFLLGCGSTTEVESPRDPAVAESAPAETSVDVRHPRQTAQESHEDPAPAGGSPQRPEIRLVSGSREVPAQEQRSEEPEFSLARFQGSNPVLIVLGENRKPLLDLLSQFRKRLESNDVVVIEVYNLDRPQAKMWEGEALPAKFAQQMAERFPVKPNTATVVLLDAEGEVGIKEEGVTSPLALMLKLATYDSASTATPSTDTAAGQ